MTRLLTLPAQRKPKFFVLALSLVVVMALSPFSGKFEDAQENEATSFLPGDAESVRALRAIEQFPDGQVAAAVTIVSRDGGLTGEDERLTQELAQGLEADPPIITAGTQGPIPSEDGEALLVITQVRDTGGTGEDFLDSVTDIRDRAHALRGGGREVEVTGAAGYGADAIEVFGDINGTLLFAAGGLVLILLILIYRSPIFWTIPFFTVLFAEASARGIGYLLAEAGVTINGQSGGILPVLVFGAGTDYALLLVSRYREELRRHDSSHEAMELALRTAGPAVLFSGLTVMAALLVLVLAEVNGTAGLGPIGAMGILMAMTFMLTMLPAALVVVGRRAFWPFVPDGPGGPLKPHTNVWRRVIFSLLVGGVVAGIGSFASGRAAAGIGLVAAAPLNFFVLAPLFHRLDLSTFYPRIERPLAERHRLTDETHGFWRRVGDSVAARPRRVALGTVAVLLVLTAGMLTLDTGLTSGNSFRGEVESVRGQEILAQHFPAGANVPTTVVIPDAADVAPVGAALEADPVVAAVGEPAKGPPGTKVDVQLSVDPYSTAAFDEVPGLRETVKEAGGEDVLVGGPTAAEYDLRQSATRDNWVIIPITLVVVFGILAVLLRSLAAPAMLVATVILSFSAALGTGMFVSKEIFGFPGIDPALPLLCFVFLVALGIDYNIFLMARVREETLRHGTREGMLRGLAVTGAVITSAGIVLAGTFGALAVLPLIFLTEIGFVVAFGVLLDTFVVRSILVPALTFIWDRRIWWPSRLMR
jgi:RND superfamily putative drug exporter